MSDKNNAKLAITAAKRAHKDKLSLNVLLVMSYLKIEFWISLLDNVFAKSGTSNRIRVVLDVCLNVYNVQTLLLAILVYNRIFHLEFL